MFFDVLPFLGPNREVQVATLWKKIQAYYKAHKGLSQLETLTIGMIKAQDKPPKLRSKAAVARHLLPFALELAKEFAGKNDHMHRVSCLVEFLAEMYGHLGQHPYPAAAAATACRKFCALFTQLENEAIRGRDLARWRMKPKIHLLQELIEFIAPELGSPDLWWTYRDESWGGCLAKYGERRGGPKHAAAVALAVLRRFMSSFND